MRSDHDSPMRNGSDHPPRGSARVASYDRPRVLGAALLRAVADGELLRSEHPALRAHLEARPEDRARIAFEVGLRSACARVMGEELLSPRAAAALRATILDRVGAGRARAGAADAPVRLVKDPHAPPRPVAAGRGVVRGWFGRNAMALAAAFVLFATVLGLVLVGNANGWGQPLPVRLAAFLPNEHGRCGPDSGAFRRKMVVRDRSELDASIRGLPGAALSIPRLEAAGFRFRGAGPCAVPGPGESVHLVFEGADGTGRLSVFLQEDKGALPLEPGVTYTLPWDDTPDGTGPEVVLWSNAGTIYYLVSGDEALCGAAQVAFGTQAARREPLRAL